MIETLEPIMEDFVTSIPVFEGLGYVVTRLSDTLLPLVESDTIPRDQIAIDMAKLCAATNVVLESFGNVGDYIASVLELELQAQR